MSFHHIEEFERRGMLPGTSVRFLHTERMTFAYWSFEAGATLPEHGHDHEQVTNVLEGQFELTIDGEARRIGPNEPAIIPPGAAHSGKAVTDCYILDVFCPVREDYR